MTCRSSPTRRLKVATGAPSREQTHCRPSWLMCNEKTAPCPRLQRREKMRPASQSFRRLRMSRSCERWMPCFAQSLGRDLPARCPIGTRRYRGHSRTMHLHGGSSLPSSHLSNCAAPPVTNAQLLPTRQQPTPSQATLHFSCMCPDWKRLLAT